MNLLSKLRLPLAALALSVPLWATAQVVDVAGVKFQPNTQVAGKSLVLNGAGIRYKAIFKVYAAGLYLPAKTDNPDTALAPNSSKRIEVHMLRDIDANELGKLLTKGMELNATRDEFSKAIPGVIKLGEMFATYKKLNTGDSFAVDFVPGTGTVVSVNGKQAIEAVKEPEFFTALLKIWLGKNPADDGLKASMLGAETGKTSPRRG